METSRGGNEMLSSPINPLSSSDLSPSTPPSYAAQAAEVRAWLATQFETMGKDVPDFEYTPQNVAHLHAVVAASKARTRASEIVSADYRRKASEYRSETARIREILESVGLSTESLSQSAVSSVQVLASVANLLNIRDTEMSSFMVAMGDLMLRKTDAEEKRSGVQKESRILLENTRKAISKLASLKKVLADVENENCTCEEEMEHWKTKLAMMDSKEQEYLQKLSQYQTQLNHVGYTPDINHGMLTKLAEHKKDLERKTKPILETLRSYQDLPPDKTLAALAIEDKKRQYAAAEKYLEEVLHSALTTTE
ncbi:hypothetical protein QJS10_CPA02g01523 [Acorus calamus]|uniref:HAUS augmin-like complex subunit 1 n=1 Tax=Acorus calamus TaxID=4465 RepID=A0AAV9FDH2_ACOCL|nr:hypothetical protein QJS10_CPA02g01523 [Acorus calamus]